MMPMPLRGVGRPHKDHSPDELHVSVLTGRCKRIKALLRKGVHIESVNCHGQTPLFCACWGGDTEVVTLLLRLGANPNRRCGSTGATPVHAAAYRGSRRVLRLLLEAGGDLSAKDNDNLLPREYAEKQPSPIRRQKILAFLDLLLAAMTLHRGHHMDPLRGHDVASSSSTPAGNSLIRRSGYQGTLEADPRVNPNKSTLNRSKKSLGSVTSVWAACVAGELPSPHAQQAKDTTLKHVTAAKSVLHKSVSCHLVDQLCVTTSLPLLAPTDLHRPTNPGLAYTCGGPTVYSPYTWLGTPVTVRRPTPALTLSAKNKAAGKPDQEAVLYLLEELSILRRLRHPAFLEVMAACHVQHPDHVTLVFQHVPYGSLYHHLHVMHRDLSVCGAVEVLVGVVEGLLFLHAHGWLHAGLSSHALHLVSTNHAKLGGFQHAIQQQAKGECSMQADQLARATWLVPWQSPEVLAEAMVSSKSEVYALAAIIWEIWAGMPPWSGVSEDDVRRRVGIGETLPYLQGAPPSLVMYLTQYGLKWNAHERDLDLHEIHTMLRSLRVQVDEDERVPSVPSWGPPSVPNTPVVGRLVHQPNTLAHNNNNNISTPPTTSSSSTSNTNTYSCPSTSARSSSEIHPSQYLQFVTIDQSMLSSSSSCSSVHIPVARTSDLGHQHRQPQMPPATLFTLSGKKISVNSCKEPPSISQTDGFIKPKQTSVQVHEPPHVGSSTNTTSDVTGRGKRISFHSISSRTPSPYTDATSISKSVTSTPHRSSSSLRPDLPPDLLPSKYLPNNFMPCITPDVLSRGKDHSVLQQTAPSVRLRHHGHKSVVGRTSTNSNKIDSDKTAATSDSDTDHTQDFTFISNNAKRAFFTDSEGSAGSKSPSPTNERTVARRHRGSLDNGRPISSQLIPYDKESITERIVIQKDTFEAQDTKGPIRTDVVRRGLSLSNLLNIGSGSMVTRTFSHVSLCSADSSATSSSSVEGRRPQRTISQVTLTLKKISTADSSSSSSRDELEQASKNTIEDQTKNSSRYRRSKSLPKSPQHTKSPRQWEEVTGIKPASHQLTRHSSSCSLSSGGPPSPVHQFVNPAVRNKYGSLPTSPQHQSPTSVPLRPNSVYGAGLSTFGSTISIGEPTSIRVNPRRHSDAPKPRPRRIRRKTDIEPEEEFIDDEFNASLYDQPHMQLSVGSSENLLDNRLSVTSMMADDSVVYQNTSTSVGRQYPASNMSIPAYSNNSRHTLNALPENSDEDLSLTLAQSVQPGQDELQSSNKEEKSNHQSSCVTSNPRFSDFKRITSWGDSKMKTESSSPTPSEVENKEHSVSDTDSILGTSPSRSDFAKDYEPLKSVQLLRNLGKSLSLYLPKHSFGSDSEIENL